MNRSILLMLGGCLYSCAANSVSPVLGKNSEIISGTDQYKPRETKLPPEEDKAVSLLNQLFNSDTSSKSMVLVINNISDCDFIMNIAGAKSYRLPVGSKKSESIILEIGDYEMTANVCDGFYKTSRTFLENTQLNIKYTFVKNSDLIPVNTDKK